jgi:hypothetical protein
MALPSSETPGCAQNCPTNWAIKPLFNERKKKYMGHRTTENFELIFKDKGRVVCVHAINSYRGHEGAAPLICTLGIAWERMCMEKRNANC